MERVPLEVAEKIANDYGYPEVAIFVYDPISGKQHLTTYGKTNEQCIDAIRAGKYLEKSLGWPNECMMKPEDLTKKQLETVTNLEYLEDMKHRLLELGMQQRFFPDGCFGFVRAPILTTQEIKDRYTEIAFTIDCLHYALTIAEKAEQAKEE